MVVSATLDFELYTFVLVIQIRTSRYLESNITLEVNDRTYMHIGTVCTGTFYPRVFYTVAEVSFLVFYSGPCYLFDINRITCKEYFKRKRMCVIVQQ